MNIVIEGTEKYIKDITEEEIREYFYNYNLALLGGEAPNGQKPKPC
jgi:hypothetical protein